MTHDIFISYSSEDKAIADAVVTAFETNGLRCWVAPRDIKPGADWGDSITKAIDISKVVLLIFSGNANRSKRVLDEIYYAISEEKIILPFRVEKLDPTGAMRLHLSSRHWLDAYQPSWQAHINQLVNSAAYSLGREPAIPAGQDNPPAPVIENVRKEGKKVPWLWVGLTVVLAAILGVAGFVWFGSRNAVDDGKPTALTAQMTNNSVTPASTQRTITVTSVEDSGAGTLRQALLDAQSGDTITFDPGIFPPDNPTKIYLTSGTLPRISKGNITIDGSNAGVGLNGSQLPDSSYSGLVINSDYNTVMGLLITDFGTGIYLEGGSNNIIGGDRSIGAGPLGQGNLLSNNYVGIGLLSMAGGNKITGNFIGTEKSGSEPLGNWKAGIWIEDNQSYNPAPNIIGPDNVIAYNGADVPSGEIACGVGMDTADTAMTITGNSIYDNAGPGIFYNVDDAARTKYSTPPTILYFDLDSGLVSGQACYDCIVEIFSTDTQDGKIYEGTIAANELGNFSFSKGVALSGPYLSATATRPSGGNTSEFSQATSARSDIQIALDAIQVEVPTYLTSFDTWDFGDLGTDGRIEAGKLIVTSEGEHVGKTLQTPGSDKFAVEFDLRILESGPEGHCIYYSENGGGGESFRSIANAFLFSPGNSILLLSMQPGIQEDLAYSTFDVSIPNTVTLVVLGDQIGVFYNGQIANNVLDPDVSAVYSYATFAASHNIVCEYDNYKFWDLSGVDFDP